MYLLKPYWLFNISSYLLHNYYILNLLKIDIKQDLELERGRRIVKAVKFQIFLDY